MTCIKTANGFICLADIYAYEGYIFEMHSYLGPCLLRKRDLEPSDRISGPKSKFWPVFDKWDALSEEEKEGTRLTMRKK